MADREGRAIDPGLSQPAPGSGTPQPAIDGREWWRRRAVAWEWNTWAIVVAWLSQALEAELMWRAFTAEEERSALVREVRIRARLEEDRRSA